MERAWTVPSRTAERPKGPQPDYVLLQQTSEQFCPDFGEHDRATEPIARWSEKLAAYAAAREWSEDLFGHSTFMVDVSVLIPWGHPLNRLGPSPSRARSRCLASFVDPWRVAARARSLPDLVSGGGRSPTAVLKPRDHANASA